MIQIRTTPRTGKVWAGIDDATLRALLIAGASNRRIACALNCTARDVYERRKDLAHVVRCSSEYRAGDPDAFELIDRYEHGNRRPVFGGPFVCCIRKRSKHETTLSPESRPGDVPGEWRTVWRRRYLFGAFTITKQTTRTR